jgi:hypothetical protein
LNRSRVNFSLTYRRYFGVTEIFSNFETRGSHWGMTPSQQLVVIYPRDRVLLASVQMLCVA